ncbi:MAG: hypothetical protein ABIJ31_11630, partial [Pseudomonadota bacterium]
MKNLFFIVIVFCSIFISTLVFGQMQGVETAEPVIVYKGTFVVNGDKDTYYPVVFKNGSQYIINHLKIYRGYSETGPSELSTTHKGSLLLEIDTNYGGWGGSIYDYRIMDLRQKYHDTFAGAAHGMHNKGFIIWLRGGGFVYHYESDKKSYLQVAYDTNTLIYDSKIDSYDVYAPAFRTIPDTNAINSHSINHISYLSTSGNVGIGTKNPEHKLSVKGAIGAQEIIVTQNIAANNLILTNTSWADYVF